MGSSHSPDRLPLPLPALARTRAPHPAIVAGTETITYADLAARADDLARRLAGLGVRRGDRVALLLPNGSLFAALVHAAARLEAVIVPLNTRLAADELAWQVADAAPRVLLHAGQADLSAIAASTNVGARGGEVRRRLTTVSALSPADLAADAHGAGPTLIDARDLATLPAPEIALASEVPLGAPHAIIYTSGTSGRPKGAVLSYGNLLWGALGSALRIGAVPDDRWLAPLPLFHVGGLAILWRAALSGATVHLPDRFDAVAVARSLEADAITCVSLVPTMLARVLDAWGDRPAPPTLRALLVGGGPAAAELVARALDLGFPVAVTYGLTEAASQVATAWPGTGAGAEGRLGAPPLAFTELRIVGPDGPDGAAPPPDTDGEILVRGPTVMTGYWNAPEATAVALAGGWLHTGDIGRLDAAGHLHLAGRRDDLIVSGGENIYPAEIEALLEGHPAVAESCVIGMPDPEWGERVVAVIVPLTATAVDPTAIEAFLRAHLAGYKVPRQIIPAEALPRTATGKVRRAELRDRVLGGMGEIGAGRG